jgi:hypothetical protein
MFGKQHTKEIPEGSATMRILAGPRRDRSEGGFSKIVWTADNIVDERRFSAVKIKKSCRL